MPRFHLFSAIICGSSAFIQYRSVIVLELSVVAHLRVCFFVFEALLDQLREAGTSGDTLASESLASMLENAQRMVKEMEDRNFTPQKTAAAKERDEAKKCKILVETSVNSSFVERVGRQ